MAKITGKTFDNKEMFKSYGARWNSVDQAWTCDDVIGARIQKLNLPGVIVTMSGDLPKPTETKIRVTFATGQSTKRADGDPETDVVVGDRQFVGKFAMNPRLHMGFGSLGEFVDYVSSHPHKGSDHNAKWAGGTMTDAIDLARYGWADGVDLAADAAEVIVGDHYTARVAKYAIAGGRVNVGRMLSGDPLHMKLRARQPSNKSITLFVDTVVSSFVDQQAMIIRAAAVAAMVDIMETNGYSAEIVAVAPADRYEEDGRGYVVATKVKTAGEPLNLADVVFALGHPTYLRQFVFSAVRQHSIVGEMHGGMGVPRGMTGLEPESGEFYIGRFNAEITGGDFKSKVRAMFPHIVPTEFPVKLRELFE